ncbi:MAG: hypothetical protein IJX92_04390 [Clostridia bacterium]|nr:hypothetical protein [Clostridia bacterium]
MNVFTTLYEMALSHAAEIFSCLSLIGTMVVSILYKKGLLPSVKEAISSIGASVTRIKESTDKQSETSREAGEKMSQRLDGFEEKLSEFSDVLNKMEERLYTTGQIYEQNEKTRLILSEQVDMLHDIFMSSSLPQYQKEAVGKRSNKMKAELEKYEKCNE